MVLILQFSWTKPSVGTSSLIGDSSTNIEPSSNVYDLIEEYFVGLYKYL